MNGIQPVSHLREDRTSLRDLYVALLSLTLVCALCFSAHGKGNFVESHEFGHVPLKSWSRSADDVDDSVDSSSTQDGQEGSSAESKDESKVGRDASTDGTETPPSNSTGGLKGQVGASVSLSQIGEDLFLVVNLATLIIDPDWALAPRIPLRIRLLDNAPGNKAMLRDADWDEASDFARMLAFFRIGQPGEPFYLRLGEFPGVTLGHGSLVRRYFNTADIDHYQGGLFATLDLDIFGCEILLDNVLGPELAFARTFVRPMLALEQWPRFLREFKVAMSFGADFSAPEQVVVDATSGEFVLGSGGEPDVRGNSILPMVGLDLEFPVFSNTSLDVLPYMDLNLLDWNGFGLHVGTLFNIAFGRNSGLDTKLEYRLASPQYDPHYVDAFYEVTRLQHVDGLSKSEWLRREKSGLTHGFLAETELFLFGLMRLSLAYAHDTKRAGEAPSHDLLMKLHLSGFGPIQLAFFVAQTGVGNLDELFKLDETVFALWARYHILDLFYVQVRVVNEWWLRRDETQKGRYETTTNFDMGAGFLVEL